MKKIISLLLFVVTFVGQLHAQEQLSKKELADRMFERGEYAKCLGVYLDLADKNNARVTVVERVADCYRLMNDYRHAEDWYASALKYYGANRIDTYYYAEALLANNKIAAAREQYTKYFDGINDKAGLSQKLATCDSAIKWTGEPSGYQTKAVDKLNTNTADWGLTYYGDKGMVFTSDRPTGDNKTYDRTGNSYMRLYQVKDDLISLLPITLKNKKLFNGNYHIGPIAFSKTCDTAYITVTTTVLSNTLPAKKAGDSKQRVYQRRLQLLTATLKDGSWGDMENFPYNDVQQYSLGQAALSADGSIIYFTSDKPGGYGETDIWYCTKQADGTWAKPVNCGNKINTKAEEAFPMMNNGVLYFSSKGLPGMGGFDVFKASGSANNWQVPINLSYPVNTTRDDFYLATKDGITGYLSSNREDNHSDDIYSFTFKPLPPKVTVPKADPMVPGLVLANIYYDLDKANIRPDAAQELDKLVAILKAEPALKVQLSSYTDSRATKDYNIDLSERRSASAKAYLVGHGILAERLLTASFGENNLVNQCADGETCTEAQHQLNRRTEISIIK